MGASGNHFHFIFAHHLTWDQPRPHTSSMIFSLGSPTSVVSGRGRGIYSSRKPYLGGGGKYSYLQPETGKIIRTWEIFAQILIKSKIFLNTC
jgi:hypothetical protein